MDEESTDMDLDEFMEVVMTYRCKFCDFTSTSTQQIAIHVRDLHQKRKKVIEKTEADNSSQHVTETLQLSGVGHLQNDPKAVSVHTQNDPSKVSVHTQGVTSGEIVHTNNDLSYRNPDKTKGDNHDIKRSVLVADENNKIVKDSYTETSSIATTHEIDKTVRYTLMGSSLARTTDQINKNVENNYAESNSAQITGNTNKVDSFVQSNNAQNVAQSGIAAVSTDSQQTGVILDPSMSISNIQFIDQDFNEEFIVQDGENIQLDGVSTVQVLVQTSEFESVAEEINGQETKVTENGVGVHKTEPLSSANSGEELQFIIESGDVYNNVVEKTDSSVENAADNKTGFDNLAPTADQDSTSLPADTVEFAEADDNHGTAQREVEFFLCGNCRQGFATIQECKAHMTQEHGLPGSSNSSKVDAGTQMEPRKKVGRKKNSELLAAKKEIKEEEIVWSDSDEDWSEKLEMYSYSKRSQRRRQPPKTLKNDFYLGKSKKKMPKKREDPGLNIVCPLKGCSGRFRAQETLDKHLECHIHGAKASEHQFKCLMCEEKFLFWKQARYHLWKIHKVDMDLLTCPTCQVFKTDTMSKLKIHAAIHSEERNFACNICGKAFKQAAQLMNHQATHQEYKQNSERTGDNEKWHMPKTCDICERTFANAKCLKIHKDVLHAQIKRFKCRYCDHECSRKAMWILHERTHTGEKPFKCDQCHYSCGDHNSLRRHKMRHTGQKPYKCPHCPYACIQAISLKVHIKNKHPGMGGIYNCSMCLYRTVNMQQYENHLKDHKNGLIEKTVENADSQSNVKANLKHRKSKSLLDKQEVTTIALNPSMIPNFNTQNIALQNISLPQIVHIPASAMQEIDQNEPLQMQIEMKETDNHIISSDEIPDMTGYDGVAQSDMAAAQLIYSALSAISQNSHGDNNQVVAGMENGDIQTSIETDSSQGVTTHTITFHIPESEDLSGRENIVGQVQHEQELTVIKVDDGANIPQFSTNSSIHLQNT